MSILFWMINLLIIAFFSMFCGTRYCGLGGFKSYLYPFLFSLLCGIIGAALGIAYGSNYAKLSGGGPQVGAGAIFAVILLYGGIGFVLNVVLTNISAWGYYFYFLKQ